MNKAREHLGKIASDKKTVLGVVAAGAPLVLFGGFFDRGIGYLTRLVLARSFTVADYGLIFLVLSVLKIIIAFSIFNMQNAAMRYASYYRGKGDESSVRGAIISAFKISLPVSVAAFIALLLSSEYISIHVFHEPAMAPIMIGLSFIVLLTPIARISLAATTAFQTIKYDVYARNIGKNLSTLLALIVLIWMGLGLIGVVAAYLVGYVVMFFLSIFFLHKLFPFMKSGVKAVSMKKKHLIFATPLVFQGLIWSFNTEMATLVLGMLRSTADVGIFQSVLPSTAFLMLLPPAIMTLYTPIATGMLSQGKKESIKKMSRAMFKWAFYLDLPVFIALFLYSDIIITTLFGPAYIAGGVVLKVVSIGIFISMVSKIPAKILYTYEKTMWQLPNSIIIISVNIGLNLLLVPIYGIMGAGIAMTAMFAVLAILYFVEAYKFSGIFPITLKVYKSVLAGILASLFLILADKAFPNMALHVLAIVLIVFVMIFGLLLLVFGGIESEDLPILRLFEKKTGIRSKRLRRIIMRFIKK